MMTSRYEDEHWLERSNSHQEHWDKSPWPAQLAQSIMSHSDGSEMEDEDSTPSLLQRPSSMAKMNHEKRSKSTEHVHFDGDSYSLHSEGTSSGSRPKYSRGVSHRYYRNRSNSSAEAPLSEVILQRRHSRMRSATEPAVEKLHIDTILPVRLPPVNLRALSPVNAYPCPWWSTAANGDTLRRSESTNSFLSASSDGSWHGDHGDEDPDKQLDEALARISTVNAQKTKDGLIISTYDYNEMDDFHPSDNVKVISATTAEVMHHLEESEASEIKSYAGLLMSNIAHYFLDDDKSIFRDEDMTPTASQHTLTRSASDSAFAGSVSSISQLDAEASNLRQNRRLRAGTDANTTGPSTSLHHSDQSWTANKLNSLWQWFLPTVDDHLEHDLFGYPRPSLQSRTSSVPSLTSLSTSAESVSLDDDHIPIDDATQGHLYDITLSKKDMVPKSPVRRVSSFVAKDAPSPLWDNSLAEEPYQRTWTSVLGLTSM